MTGALMIHVAGSPARDLGTPDGLPAGSGLDPAGMSTGQATAMTLLSDDGLDATYLAANVRPRPVPPTRRAGTAESRLTELQSLLDRGLVTSEEYAARRKAILDSI